MRAIAGDVFKTVQLAAEKAAAHIAKPAKYPMPEDAESLEHLMLARLNQLKPAARDLAVKRTMLHVGASEAVRKGYYRRFPAVDLRKPIPVSIQAAEAAPSEKFTLSPALIAKIAAQVPAIESSEFQRVGFKHLDLKVIRVVCLDETNGFLGSEWGRDEIHLGGSAIDAAGKTHLIPDRKIGDFDEDDHPVEVIPAAKQTLFSFGMEIGGDIWPKYSSAILVLAEKDMGGFPDWLNKLVTKVRDEIAKRLAAVGAALGSVVGAAIGAAVGYVLGLVIDWIKQAWSDEILTPCRVTVRRQSAYQTFGGGTEVGFGRFVAGAGGSYRIDGAWSLRS